MRRPILGLAVALVISASASTVSAQQGFSPGFSDPFFLYYGFYLPRQAALAATPTTPNMINDVAAARQNNALNDRAGLYDPIASPFSPEQLDPLSPFGPRRGPTLLPRLPVHFVSPRPHNGLPPVPYYNRTARYFPTIRSGSGPNHNMVSTRRAVSGVPAGAPGIAGMGGMGVGIPGR